MSVPVDVDALTPDQIRAIIGQRDWYIQLSAGDPQKIQADVQSRMMQELIKLTDLHAQMLKLLEELVEIQRLRAAMSREYLDQEEKP